MCTAEAVRADGGAFNGPADAVRVACAALDYLSAAAGELSGTARGDLLIALGEAQAKLTAAHAAVLRPFDAASDHDADGYGSSSAWLAAKAGMSKKGARAAVAQMRQLDRAPAARYGPGRRPDHRLACLRHRRLDAQAAG